MYPTPVLASTTVLQRQENIYNDDRSVTDVTTITAAQLSTSDLTGFTKLIGNRLIKEEQGLYFDKPYERNEYDVVVNHYKENANDSNYTKDSSNTVHYKYETVFNPTTKSFTGFETTSSRSYEVPAKDTTFRYDYIRKRYTLTVNHRKGNIGNTSYIYNSANNYTLKYEQDYTPTRNSYTGFSQPSASNVHMPNSNKSIDYNYPRNKYRLTLQGDRGIASITSSQDLYYEQTLNIQATTSTGYLEDPKSNHDPNNGGYSTNELVGDFVSWSDTSRLSNMQAPTATVMSSVTRRNATVHHVATATFSQDASAHTIVANTTGVSCGQVYQPVETRWCTEYRTETFNFSEIDEDANGASTKRTMYMYTEGNAYVTWSYRFYSNNGKNADGGTIARVFINDSMVSEEKGYWHSKNGSYSGELSSIGVSSGGANMRAKIDATFRVSGNVSVAYYVWTETYRPRH